MFKRWNYGKTGIHIIQHFPLDKIKNQVEQFDNLIKSLVNPVVAILTLTHNPRMNYSHTIKRTARQNFDRIIALKNALAKYPMTEMVLLEGNEDIVLYGGQPFGIE